MRTRGGWKEKGNGIAPRNDSIFGLATTTKKRRVSDGNGSGGGNAKRAKIFNGRGLVEDAFDSRGSIRDVEVAAATCGLVRRVNGSDGDNGNRYRIVTPHFQSIEPGTLLLGLIKRVTRRQLNVALPYGLSGYVPVHDIADFQLFEDTTEMELEDDASNYDDADNNVSNCTDGGGKPPRRQWDLKSIGGGGGGACRVNNRNTTSLESFFAEGQVVRCAVLSKSSSKNGGKSIHLSLRPSHINRGLFLEHLAVGNDKKARLGSLSSSSRPPQPLPPPSLLAGVYGAVRSKEDHGYIISFGGPDMGFTGFLNDKDIDCPTTPVGTFRPVLRVGQPLELAVVDVNATARTVSVIAKRQSVLEARLLACKCEMTGSTQPPPIRAIKPGALVSATVVRLVDNGLVVKFGCSVGQTGAGDGELFVGVVEQSHLPVHCKQAHWRSVYKTGDRITSARVLSCDYATRGFTLTLRPHLLSLDAPAAGLGRVGLVIENAEVIFHTAYVVFDPATAFTLSRPLFRACSFCVDSF
jgi:hypothetical protein